MQGTEDFCVHKAVDKLVHPEDQTRIVYGKDNETMVMDAEMYCYVLFGVKTTDAA